MPCTIAGFMKNRSSSGWATRLTEDVAQSAAAAGETRRPVALAARATSPATEARAQERRRGATAEERADLRRNRVPVTNQPSWRCAEDQSRDVDRREARPSGQ